MCCLGAAIRLNIAPQRLSVAESLQHPLVFQPSLSSIASCFPRRHLSIQREALADIKTEVDKNFNVTRKSKISGLWESVIGLEVHAQVMNARLRLTVLILWLSDQCCFQNVLLRPHRLQCSSQLECLIFRRRHPWHLACPQQKMCGGRGVD